MRRPFFRHLTPDPPNTLQTMSSIQRHFPRGYLCASATSFLPPSRTLTDVACLHQVHPPETTSTSTPIVSQILSTCSSSTRRHAHHTHHILESKVGSESRSHYHVLRSRPLDDHRRTTARIRPERARRLHRCRCRENQDPLQQEARAGEQEDHQRCPWRRDCRQRDGRGNGCYDLGRCSRSAFQDERNIRR